MKLPASTWILILLALGLGGFVYYQEVYRSNQLAIDRSANNKLFDLKKEDIEKIAIVLPKQTIELEKTARDIDPWQLKKPNDVVANKTRSKDRCCADSVSRIWFGQTDGKARNSRTKRPKVRTKSRSYLFRRTIYLWANSQSK
jgi:hypothetical protein